MLELDGAQGWQLGRTADGYALRLDGTPRFDLTEVYRLIRRDRLSAIWADPETGELRLGLGCACHAQPFAFRPDILVIDLHDGPPPDGSAFENPVTGVVLPLQAKGVAQRPKARPARPMDLPQLEDPALTGLRDALLEQLSRGVARGVVDMATELPTAGPLRPLAQMRVGAEPGFDAAPADREEGHLTGDGSRCMSDAQLDVSGWGSDQPVAAQMAAGTAGLLGEFFAPDEAGIGRALRQLLYLGFGAEALHLLRHFGSGLPDRAILDSMARIMDDGQAQDGAFAGMAPCDTAAALWATLAAPQGVPQANTAAVLRSFSALPLHLRRHLGPGLAERFLARGETGVARAIRDAILRAGPDSDPAVQLMNAELDMAQGQTATAEQALADLAAESGPGHADAMIAWVEQLVATGRPVDPSTVTTLAALSQEHRGGTREPALQRAHILALAAAGDFDSAFALRDQSPGAEAGLWTILAESGPDSALLAHGIRPAGELLPDVTDATRTRIAERLIRLGLGAAALHWLQPETTAGDGHRLLAAEAELARRDARAALRHLAGLPGEAAESLRAKAALQLGDAAMAATAYEQLDDRPGQLSAAKLAEDWAQLAADSPPPWQSAAVLATEPLPTADGALARANALIAESSAARTTLTGLLAATPNP
ncbi:hypothetical protein GEU84_009435 [Fertoebacter nigrum]|uniref:Uncharacterized protein n=1 Tax=Fertoeibacter niger TaxID=2656921 RepID=A0A8X8H2W5_9RHOB|nr:hypothetical protein [Fertoeibacter niger]NUB44603.1 hypothetical protein [Fertoeibacter niger]